MSCLMHSLGAVVDSVHPPTQVDHALHVISRTRGVLSIEAVARHVGVSTRHLERQFRDHVGLGLKQTARIARIHAVLNMVEQQPVLSGAEIAAACGYSDQAHLIRECQQLTGFTPLRLRTTDRSLSALMREAVAGR